MSLRLASTCVVISTLLSSRLTLAQSLSIDSRDDILESAGVLVADILSYHYDADAPGLLSNEDYRFWQSGVLWTTLIDYRRLTGDDEYDDVVTRGLLSQKGANNDFQPPGQRDLRTFDHCLWGSAAMLAAESGLPNPTGDDGPHQWIELAEAVFGRLKADLDEEDPEGKETCGGGLRAARRHNDVGYYLKESLVNGCMVDLGARLARYTGNSIYSEIAADVWDWLEAIKLIDVEEGKVYISTGTPVNCSVVSKWEDSHAAALLINGAAFMYNISEGSADLWQGRVENLTRGVLKTFFPVDVLVEHECEEMETCQVQNTMNKALTIHYLSIASQLAPFVASDIRDVLEASAEAAVEQCTGEEDGRRCGFFWAEGKYVDPVENSPWDTPGAGEQLNVLAAVSHLLIAEADPPVVADPSNDRNSSDGNKDDGDDEGAAGRVSLSLSVLLGGVLASILMAI